MEGSRQGQGGELYTLEGDSRGGEVRLNNYASLGGLLRGKKIEMGYSRVI